MDQHISDWYKLWWQNIPNFVHTPVDNLAGFQCIMEDKSRLLVDLPRGIDYLDHMATVDKDLRKLKQWLKEYYL